MVRFDYTRTDVVFMDIETQSCANLRTVGSKAYIRDRSTRLMSACFVVGDRVITWVPHCTLPLVVPGELHRGPECPSAIRDLAHACWVAHNGASFDAPAWQHFFGWSPSAWQDTLPIARQHGLPGGLDRVGQALLGRGKDKSGSAAMKLLCAAKAGRDGMPVYPVGTAPLWEQMLAYNIEDVLLMKDVYTLLPIAEPQLLNRDAEINQRGIYVDQHFAGKLYDVWEEFKRLSGKAATAATKGELTEDDLRSHSKVKAWLAKNGIPLASLNRATIEQMMEDPDSLLGDTDNPQAVLAVEILRRRIDATKSSSAKIHSLLANMDEDCRIRDLLVYHKAHTGRWSGRVFQPHNLPRGLSDIPVQEMRADLTLAAIQQHAPGRESDALSTFIRPILCAPPGRVLVTADYAGIEARGIAWVAREEQALDIFRDPARDIYCEFGGVLYGRPITKKDKSERQVSKVVVLGCGYGMGANKFGITARMQKVDLEAAGVTAEQCVKLYRSTYARIPAVWRSYQQAAFRAVQQGVASIAGRCEFSLQRGCLCIELPSGRILTYRNPRIEKQVPVWGGPPVDTLLYDSPIFSGKVLYGGLLAENIVQAICRDLLAFSILSLDEIVLHVHDEIVLEVDEARAESALDAMLVQMSNPPKWAADFPILVEGFTSPHYVKSVYKGYMEAKALGGTVLTKGIKQ